MKLRTLLAAAGWVFSGYLMAAEQATAPSLQWQLNPASSPDVMLDVDPDIIVPMTGSKEIGAPTQVGTLLTHRQPIAISNGQGDGQWATLADGRLLWRLAVTAPGADWLDFELLNLKMPKDGELYVSDKDATTSWRYDYSELQSGSLYTAGIPGDSGVLEVLMPAGGRAGFSLELGATTYGILGITDDGDSTRSGSCNVDVVCSAGNGKGNQIRSVGRYSFRKSGSTFVCTGTLIANTGNSLTPYFLTANHCVSSETVADTLVVYWNYQSSTCRTPGSSSSGTPLPLSTATHSQSGSLLRATYSPSDVTLLQLDARPAAGANTYYAGWSRSSSIPGSAYGIHHPAGHEKRIAIENNALASSGYLSNPGVGGSSHLRVADWDQGTTEGGSSGSALFNSSNLIVGQLHGGYAACGNNSPDWYGRFFTSWTGGGSNSTRLSNWLNPTGSTATSKSGYEGP
ncbi:MAG: hypothetical protein Tsb002_37370 [Wenzhouxiangellaceae bacterium]